MSGNYYLLMASGLRTFGRIVIAAYLITLHLFAGYLAIRYFYPDLQLVRNRPIESVSDPILQEEKRWGRGGWGCVPAWGCL